MKPRFTKSVDKGVLNRAVFFFLFKNKPRETKIQNAQNFLRYFTKKKKNRPVNVIYFTFTLFIGVVTGSPFAARS